jgi:ATP-dependent helicase/nuclease subunit A
MTAAPHTAIRASAGSGKTFQLTNRLLALFFRGAPIEGIVAATFTRKAAGEILERILKRLADGAGTAKTAKALGEEVGVPGVARDRVRELLATLTKQLHELRIGTLDSLFADLASSLGLELGLPPRWSILDPVADGELRDEAVRRSLAASPVSDLAALYRLLTKGETRRSVSRQIREAVDDLYTVFLTTDEKHWAPFELPPLLESAALQQAIADFEHVALPKNKVWEKAHAALVEAARGLDWKAFVGATIVQRVSDGADDYSRVKIGPDYRDGCSRLLEHAKASLLADLHQQTKAIYRLLDHFHRAYAPLKFSRRVMRFEDVTIALARASSLDASNEGPDVAYRLGARTRHLLLDEFQDTSPIQWKVVEPAALSIAANAEDHGFFCVGDEKQAIYGWRGGSAELFDRVRREMPSLEWIDLATSYRSAPPVIETVNAVFAGLKKNPVFDGDGRDAAAEGAKRWSRGFVPHKTAKTDLAGYVCFRTAPLVPGVDDAEEPDPYGAAARWVEEVLRSAPNATVGVLTRKNAGVARMIAELRGRGIAASQEGGNPLTDSTAVQIVLAALRFADHPGDSAGRFFVAHTPLGPALGLTSDVGDQASAKAAANIRRRLLDEGLGATVADWAERLSPHLGEREQDRLRQLVEFAFVQDAAATLRPSEFADLVGRMVFEDPAAAQVRVMTIHQSKGLEFDVVVLPELDEKLVGQTPSSVAWASEPGGMIDGVVRYVDKSVQALLPAKVRDAFEERVVKESREALCLLYVALTRAAHALLVVNAPSPTNERSLPLTLAGVLRGAVGPQGRIEPETTWYELGDPNWAKSKAKR